MILQWQASPRQSQSTLHLPGIAELRYDCCRCRKFDPVGDWRGIGQSCVGCGISAGCSSAWRGPVSVTSSAGSRSLGAQTADHRVATGQANSDAIFWLSTGSFWAGPATCFRRPAARSPSFDQIPCGIVQVSDCFGRLGRPAVPRDPTINPCPRLHIRVGVLGCL